MIKKTLLLLFVCAGLSSWAQPVLMPNSKGEGIGLVLSGGGAKAMAHIGALRVIERNGIKIDYIAGTSMGAVIGAMYSLGYTVDEIEVYLREVDWDALLSNEVPRNRLSFFDRKSGSRYILSFPVNNNRPGLPNGLNYGQYILRELSTLAQQSYKYESFSDFPIPFVCVATNLETGRLRVFEDGKLIDALRASTAFPSLFTPYELNDSLYVDGGVLSNYPVELLKEKGLKYIIGVDVQDQLYEKNDLNTVVRVLEQTSGFLRLSNYENQVAHTDVLIRPEIPEAGLTSFDIFDDIVKAGEEAALKQLTGLAKMAKVENGNPLRRDTLQAKPINDICITRINVRGLDRNTRNFVLGKLQLKEHEKCSIEKINKGMDRLYGSRYFKYVDYTLTPNDSGFAFNLDLTENTSLAQFRFGLNYNDDYKTAVLLNYTKRNLLFKNDRISVDLAIGDNSRAYLDYFVDRGYIPTLGVKFRTNQFRFRTYVQGRPVVQRVYRDYSLDFFIQSTLYDAYAFGGGIQLENVDINQDLNFDEVEGLNNNYINYYGFIDFDSFNDANYPTSGFAFLADARIIARQEGFEDFFDPSSVLTASYSKAVRLNDRMSLVAKVWGATTIGEDLDDPYKLYLGGMGQRYINYIQPFIGYRYMELVGRNAATIRSDFFWETWKNHYVTLKANFGRIEPTFDDLFESEVLFDGYSLGYSFRSPFGPLEINVQGSTNHSDIYTYARLGFWF
jgi:NTE family protein